MKLFAGVLTIVLALLAPATTVADEKDTLERLSRQIETVNYNLERGNYNHEDLAAWTKITIKLGSKATACIADNEAKIKKLQESIDALGEKADDETTAVSQQRADLQEEKEEIDKILAQCNLYLQNSEEANEQISLAEQSYFQEKYLIRGPHIYTLVIEYLKSPFELIADSGTFFWKHAGLRLLDTPMVVVDLLIVIVAIIIGIWIRRFLRKLEQTIDWLEDDFAENLARAAITTFARYSPWLFGAAATALILYLKTRQISPTPFITTFSIGLLIYIAFLAGVRFIFSPVKPARAFIDFTPGIPEKLHRRLQILASLSFLGYMAFYTIFSQSIPELNRLLLRDLFALLVVVNLILLFTVLFGSPKLKQFRWLFILMIIAIAMTLVAEWSGYRNIGLTGRRYIMTIFIAFAVAVGISRLFRDLFNAMDDGTYGWTQRLHEKLGVEEKKVLPGLVWIRLLTTIMIWGGFALITINFFDPSGSIIEHTRGYLVNGFTIGDFRIVPSKILLSLLFFALIIASTGAIKRQLETNWLPKTSIERGGREAIVTITGYVMFLVAVLVALSVAGFDFSNIAIIFGALSVGIGFGLQNIVNNFVSGLILLFERPVRRGDWVQVGTTEGYIKDINIRSTRIITFDRSDVIVPNSELISNQVTNYMLDDIRGRAIVKVGVAYGSDTEKVRYILTQIAEENDLVVKDGTSPKPLVLFRGFGESSLDFELRVHLYDVDRRLSTISNLNFEIDKAFREEGIEIPFPQRDVHLKDLPEKAEEKLVLQETPKDDSQEQPK